MSLVKAKQIAEALTEMSTTGADFLEGEMEDGRIVIERYSGEGLEEQMTIEGAIQYAGVFALGGATKCHDALTFLQKHDSLDEIMPTARRLIQFNARVVLEILVDKE